MNDELKQGLPGVEEALAFFTKGGAIYCEYTFRMGKRIAAELNALRTHGAAWQKIETAPKDREVFFWIVPKTAEETYTDSSGKPILSDGPPYKEFCKHGHWSSLNKATLWHEVPADPNQEQPADPLKAAGFNSPAELLAALEIVRKDAVGLPERIAQLVAHRACCGNEHDPVNGKVHGYCVVCGVPWPCDYAGNPPAAMTPSATG